MDYSVKTRDAFGNYTILERAFSKRGKLTLLSRRIYNVFLYHAQQQGVENPTYSILLSELIDDARFTSNNTELLKSHIRDMQATTIEWHTSSGGAQKWTSTQLLGVVNILTRHTATEAGRSGTCATGAGAASSRLRTITQRT